MRRSRFLSVAAVVFSILIILAIGAAAAVPLATGKGLPEVRLLDEFFPESGTAAGGVEVTGTMQPDGDVLVSQRVRFPDDTGNVVTVIRPCGGPPYVFACSTDVTLNGAPASITERAARTEISVAGSEATVGYTLRGATRVHTDIAILEWPLLPSAFGATPFEETVRVTGNLVLPGSPQSANIDPHLHATAKERNVTVTGGTITFETEAAPLLDVQLDMAFPPGSCRTSPTSAERTPRDGRASSPARPSRTRQTEIASQALDNTAGDLGEIRQTVERVVAGLALVVPGFLWLVVLVMLIFRLRRLAQPLPTPRATKRSRPATTTPPS